MDNDKFIHFLPKAGLVKEGGLDFLAMAGGLSKTSIIKLPAIEAPEDSPSVPGVVALEAAGAGA